MNFRRAPIVFSRSGSALISTMLVLTILTIIVVAFLQSMTVEKKTARSYLNRFRAELAAQAALSEALGRLSLAASQSKFHYAVSTQNPDSATEYLELIPQVADQPDADPTNKVALAILPGETDSSGTVDIDISPSDAPPEVKRTVAWKTLRSAAPASEEIGRYSFWTAEAAGQQDLLVHSGATPHKQLEDLREIPLMKQDGSIMDPSSATLLEPYQFKTAKADRKDLFTAATANQIITSTSRFNDRDFTLNSPAALLTPEGKPRLNLTRLKAYIDGGTYQEYDENNDPSNPGYPVIEYPGLSYKQGPDSPRFQLVKDLLNEDGQHDAEKQNPWGPGNLEIVKKIFPPDNSGDYTQARQFVADLIDYIDEDLVPTTDGDPGTDPGTGTGSGVQTIASLPKTPPKAPTVLGVEARYDTTKGGIVGHPYITYVGQGLIFNLNSGGSQINSTRILGWTGMAYPWDADANWKFGSSGGYRVEMQVGFDGTVEGGTRGSQLLATSASTGYFQPNWLAQKSGSFLSGMDALDTPTAFGKAHTYSIYPRAGASGNDLANGYFTINQPLKNLKFQNLSTKIQTLRLIYNIPGTEPRGGPRFLVQDLSALSALPRNWTPATFTPSTTIYKLGGTYGQQDWHFVGDPRLNFRQEGWSLANTTGTNMSSGASSTIKPSSSGSDLYAGSVNDRKDPLQSLNADATTWFKQSTGLANHFMVKDGSRDVNPVPSPLVVDGQPVEPPMHSYAELGFLFAGKPWETLTLFNDPGRFPSEEKIKYGDWTLLDYIDLGVLRRHNNPNSQREVTGQVNVNTGQRTTLKALLKDTPKLTDPDKPIAALLADAKRPFLSPATAFSVENFKNEGDTDPLREEFAGSIYPALTSHSEKFLVHCIGEVRSSDSKHTPLSRVHLVAEVELRYSSADPTKITPTVLRTYYR